MASGLHLLANAGFHFINILLRMKTVRIIKRPACFFRQQLADGGFTGSGNTHDDDELVGHDDGLNGKLIEMCANIISTGNVFQCNLPVP